MLLLVDDRSVDPRIAPIKEHLMEKIFPEMFSSMLGHNDLTILASSGNLLKLIRGDHSDIANRKVDQSEGLLHLLELDEEDYCVIMNRIAYFSEGFTEMIRFHRSSGSDVTAIVKELPGHLGMLGVSLDQDSNLNYRMRGDPVRSKSVDLNIYIMRKELIKDLIHSEIELLDLDVRALPLFKEDLSMKGFRLRSKVGFTDDLVSLLETQRMAMDSMISIIENVTSRNMDVGNEQILSMPVYIAKRVQIGKKCRIGPYVTILNDSRIGDNVFILNSIIGEGCIIEDDVYLEGAVIGPRNTIEKGSEIEWKVI